MITDNASFIQLTKNVDENLYINEVYIWLLLTRTYGRSERKKKTCNLENYNNDHNYENEDGVIC